MRVSFGRLGSALAVCAALGAMLAWEVARAEEPDAAADPASASPIFGAASQSTDEPPEELGRPVDFFIDIQPILSTHCVGCHGPEKQGGGLRLDSRESAERGGDSGRKVLGGPPEANELLARVSSSDRTYRMPKNEPPLAPDEIERVRQWVEQGSRWPDPAVVIRSRPWHERWIDVVAGWSERHAAAIRYLRPYAIAFIAFQVGLLVVIRCRRAYRQERPWTTGRLAGFCRFCDGVRSRELVLVMALLLVGGGLVVMRSQLIEQSAALSVASRQEAARNSPWDSVYGYPPQPVRLDERPGLARTYYRGNCERSPELFNDGNYLTAIFRVNLCDAERQPLEAGQAVPAGGLFVRVEIERAAGTTDLLFSKEMIASVVLVKNFYDAHQPRLEEKPVRLETLEDDWRWEAFVPLGGDAEEQSLRGVIYMYTGQIDQNMLSGTLHYGIEYAVQVRDGMIDEDSGLWMDSFGNHAFVPPVPPGLLPYHEWFGLDPLPVISGENTRDPTLLGVDEYVEQGLIPPPPRPASQEDSADDKD